MKFGCYGVQNASNTCTFSVLLQEFSSLPEYYEPFLNLASIQQDNESDDLYSLRQQLRAVFKACTDTLKQETVKKELIQELAHLYFKLTPIDSTISRIQVFFNSYSSFFATLPQISPYKLYESFISFFPEISLWNHKIILLSKEASTSIPEVIANSQSIQDITSRILWRIAIDRNEQGAPEEHFAIGKRLFSLKLVLCCVEKARQLHVIAYRKMMQQWVLCDDDKLSIANNIPNEGIYTAVYDSEVK